MKILFISRLFYPHIGGVEKHLLHLSKELINRGYNVSLLTWSFDKELPKEENIDGIKVFRFSYPVIKFLGLPIIWIKFLTGYFRLIKGSDIVHIHDVFVWFLPLRLIFPFKKLFITFHGYPSYPLSKTAIVFQKMAEFMSQGNICIGDFVRRWYGTNPTIVSYGAVDSDLFKMINASVKYDAIFFGRLDEQTGINCYLDGVKILRKKLGNFSFLVVGEGKYSYKAKKMASVFRPFESDISEYLSVSRFAFVSRYLSILESFASKKLVFAVYDNPLKEDYLKMTPFAKWMIIVNNPEVLASRVEYYIKNPSEAKVIVEGAYKWVKRQTWTKMADDYERLWKLR